MADATTWLRRTPAWRAARAAGAAIDEVCLRAGWLPLAVRTPELRLRGFVRHRYVLRAVAAGTYEPFMRVLFEEAVTPHALVIDGGAHIGLYTLLAAGRVRDARAVVAFEPDPYNFRALVANVRLNRREAVVHPQRVALAVAPGRAVFYGSSSSVSGSLVHRADVPDRQPYPTETVTLAEVLAGREAPVTVIKLDLEGGELMALQGAGRALDARPCVLFVEVNPRALRDAGTTADALLDLLADLGFAAHYVDEAARTLRRVVRGPVPKGNLYCTRA